jgi:hypothetical protein
MIGCGPWSVALALTNHRNSCRACGIPAVGKRVAFMDDPAVAAMAGIRETALAKDYAFTV